MKRPVVTQEHGRGFGSHPIRLSDGGLASLTRLAGVEHAP